MRRRKAREVGVYSWALGIALATIVLLATTADSIGVTWDEPVYIASAKSYVAWFPKLLGNPADALSRSMIDAYWWPVHEHPPAERVVSGLVWLATRHLFNDLVAIRLGPIILVGLLAAMLFLIVAEAHGRLAGLYGVFALLSMPRFFFHAHLAAQDVPVAFGFFAVVFVFWKTLDRAGWIPGLLWGLAWGLALLFKISAFVVPIGLAVWCYFFRPRWVVVTRLLVMGLVGCLTFVVLWPWMHFDTWTRLLEYFNRFIQYNPPGVWYFGTYHAQAPWHFALVMIWAVMPLTTIGLVFLGAGGARKGSHDRELVWLLLICVATSILPFITGRSVVFDGDRFLMPAFPLLAAVAGIGFGRLAGLLRLRLAGFGRPRLALPVVILIGLALLMPQALSMLRQFPHLLSYYSESVGGLRGATQLGLETTYWCETYGAALPYLNARAATGDKIWVERASQDVLVYYQVIGRMRGDLRIAMESDFPRDADWYVFQYRQSQTRGLPPDAYPPMVALRDQVPAYELRLEGIPIMAVYGRLR